MRLYFSFILFTFSIISFSEPRLGKDFFLLNDPLPVKQDGIVEVTDVFWYGCGDCYAMESKVAQWQPINSLRNARRAYVDFNNIYSIL